MGLSLFAQIHRTPFSLKQAGGAAKEKSEP